MNQDSKKLGFATRQIHSNRVSVPGVNPLSTPIFQTSTFVFENCAQGAARFSGEEQGYIYSRMGNPNSNQIGKKVADLENAEDGLALGSGMAAVGTLLLTLLKSGDHILADETLYGATFTLMRDALPHYGIATNFTDFSDINNILEAITPQTKIVYFETPANPTLKIVDIELVASQVHARHPEVKVVIDNTFCTPYLQKPLELGVDVVIHSGTKYLNGHGDVISGFICGSKELIKMCRGFGLKMVTGAVTSPFDAYLINRGLKTLDIRMERHSRNAMAVARFLEGHPRVTKVYYPGLESFEGHEIAKKQMKLFGGVVTFELDADKAASEKFANELELCTLAVSLGDAETLIEHPASMTHAGYSKQGLAEAGISEGMMRLSVGLEDVEDIIADLEKHLNLL